MKWEMEMEEVELVLEKIWELHDSISDAIHAVSRAHFLRSIKGGGNRVSDEKRCPGVAAGGGGGDGGGKSGYVFVKGFKLEGEEDEAAVAAAVVEARSLHAIRTALEDFEEQLELFHTVQSQQRAERDAAIARLEQSRIILAMRLADHHGKRYKVIEEAMAFVGDVCDAARFVAPEDLFRGQSCVNSSVHQEKRSNILIEMLISSFALAKKFFKFDRVGGALGNATLFALSMLAFLQLQQVTGKSQFVLEASPTQERTLYRERDENRNSHLENASNGNQMKHLDVLAARG